MWWTKSGSKLSEFEAREASRDEPTLPQTPLPFSRWPGMLPIRRLSGPGNSGHMIQDTIGKIEERLRKTDAIKDENKAELLNLLSRLKGEVSQLSRTNSEQA